MLKNRPTKVYQGISFKCKVADKWKNIVSYCLCSYVYVVVFKIWNWGNVDRLIVFFFVLDFINKLGTEVQSVPSEGWWSVSRILTKCLWVAFYGLHITFCPHQSHTSTLFHSPSSVKMSLKIIVAITRSLRGKCSKGRLSRLAGHYTLHDSLSVVWCLAGRTIQAPGWCCIRYLKSANARPCICSTEYYSGYATIEE